MLFFISLFLKYFIHIVSILFTLAIASCTGSKKYFKAAEQLEKKGLVNEAADYYLESLERKSTNVEARIKLKEVGQKYVSNLSSDFFRNYNTQQIEASLETFERLKKFTSRCQTYNVVLDYPKTYDDDYTNAVEIFCLKNYNQAYTLVNQKNFNEALIHINAIKKYNSSYKNTTQLEITSVCEPLYQNAVNYLENKNYSNALNELTRIREKTETYKDSKNLLDLAINQETKSFILFQPKPSGNKAENEIAEILFNNFNQSANEFKNIKIINNSPFLQLPDAANNSDNIDLIQAIRKASGADYFYTYSISNKNELSPNPQRTMSKAYQEVKVKKNDTLTITEYKQIDYYLVKNQRSFSFYLNYKLINAYTNQISSSQSLNIISKDAVEYNEFAKAYNGNINTLYPYHPQQTPIAARLNAANWRKLFSANTNLKSMDQLKIEAFNQAVNTFTNAILNHVK